MIKVMFVCHGNICRSPMAEFVLKNMVKEMGLEKSFVINSSATSFEEIGNPIHRGTKKKLYEVGIYCGEHRAIRITKEDYAGYDYIIVMDRNNLRNLDRIIGEDKDNKVFLLLDFTNRKGEDIADPWYTGNFDETYKDINEGCKGFIKKVLQA